MATERMYLATHAQDGIAAVLSVVDIEPGLSIVRLNRTLFHPESSEQLSDRGKVGSHAVLDVKWDAQDIDHYLSSSRDLVHGKTVGITVDKYWRTLQSTYHSSGHLLQSIVPRVRKDCVAVFGRHWPESARLVFYAAGPLSRDDVAEINQAFLKETSRDYPVEIVFSNGVRQVQLADYDPIVCHGTHVQRTSDIASMEISYMNFDGECLIMDYVVKPRLVQAAKIRGS